VEHIRSVFLIGRSDCFGIRLQQATTRRANSLILGNVFVHCRGAILPGMVDRPTRWVKIVTWKLVKVTRVAAVLDFIWWGYLSECEKASLNSGATYYGKNHAAA